MRAALTHVGRGVSTSSLEVHFRIGSSTSEVGVPRVAQPETPRSGPPYLLADRLPNDGCHRLAAVGCVKPQPTEYLDINRDGGSFHANTITFAQTCVADHLKR